MSRAAPQYSHRIGRHLLAGLALAPLIAWAEPAPMHTPQPSEFSAQMPLSVSGNNGVVQLLLPIEVYQNARSADLADLRVYNGSGQILPYTLYHASSRTQFGSREQNTALFPIYQDALRGPTGKDLQLELRTDEDGSLLSIATHGLPAASETRLAAIIIDLGTGDRNEVLESLSFDLPEGNADYRARLSIERSEDLKLWDGIANGSIDWISSADASQRLVNNRIDLPVSSGRYLKVRWLEGEPLSFAAVRAQWRSASMQINPELEVTLEATPGKLDGDFSFAASPAIVATAIGLDLPEANTVMPVSIGFYREQRQSKQPWWLVPRVENTFYRLTQNGRERVSSRIHIAPLSGAEWIVRPLTAGHAAPRLILQWQPQTLVFNAQGSGFSLAVGAPPEVYRRWLGGPAPMAQVAPGFSREEIEQLERARIGSVSTPAPATLAQTAEVEDTPDAASLRRFVLWSVLAFGVLLLGFMSWRLYGQMNAGEKAD
jgi:hypothetical protein